MKFPSFRSRAQRKPHSARRTGALGGSRLRGIEPLEQRCLLSVAPTLAPIDDVTAQYGTPLQIALNGYDADGDPLTFYVQATIDGAPTDLVTTFIPQSNRSLKMTVKDYGVMTFQLLEDRAPITSARIIELVQQGFYNTTNTDEPMIFHRVIKDFMIQAGDPYPPGDDTDGSGVTIPDEFHEDLRFSSSGFLAMANTGDPDTGDSQFFITSTPTRWLDDGYSIFGFLTTGDDVREAIENVATDSGDQPVEDIVIQSVEVFTDTQNAVLTLTVPAETASGTVKVAVTAADTQHGYTVQEFYVTIGNTPPALVPMEDVVVVPGEQVELYLYAPDADGDTVTYSAKVTGDYGVTASVSGSVLTVSVAESTTATADVTVTANDGHGGTDQLTFRVGPNSAPVLAAIASTKLEPGDVLPINLVASDADGDALTYSVEVNGDDILTATIAGTVLTVSVDDDDDVEGRADLTVTVEDSKGATAQQTFHVGVGETDPFLETMDNIITTVDTPLTVQIPAMDLDGDEIVYWGLDDPLHPNLDVVTNSATGQMTITPRNGLRGIHTILVAVRAKGLSSPNETPYWNAQYVYLLIQPPAPTSVTLAAAFDTGTSNSDGITSANTGLQFRVSGPLLVGAEARVLAGGQLIGSQIVTQADANRGWLDITADQTLEDADYAVVAEQSFGDYDIYVNGGWQTVDLASAATPATLLTIRAQAPQFLSEPVLTIDDDQDYLYNVATDEETGGSVVYSLTTAPTDMSIDSASGQITWTPQPGDGGHNFNVTVRANDLAGNQNSQSFTIQVNIKPPVFLSEPGLSAYENRQYSYDAQTDEEAGDGVVYSLTTSPTGMTIDSTTGLVSWKPQPEHGGHLCDVVICATDPTGHQTTQQFQIDTAIGPTVDYWMDEESFAVADGDYFALITSRAGRLTVEALFMQDQGDIDIELRNDAGTVVGTSASQDDNERIDLKGVAAGEVYRVHVSGANTAVVFRYTNLLVDVNGGNELIVYGTNTDNELTGGDDLFQVDVGPPHQVTVNQVLYDDVDAQTISIYGYDPNWAAEPGMDFAQITGTSAAETFWAAPCRGQLSGSDNGQDYAVALTDVQFIEATGNGGADAAKLYDSSGDDTLTTRAGLTELSADDDSFGNRVKDYPRVNTFSTAGGNDTANFYDSAANDYFYATPVEAILRNGNYFTRAKCFESVNAFASTGGVDRAELYDWYYTDAKAGLSADLDVNFSGGPVQSAMYADIPADPNGSPNCNTHFYNRVKSFEQVVAYAQQGGNDVARLYDSAGNDEFYAEPGYARLDAAGVSVEIASFADVQAFASTGNDEADLYDSPGDDTFVAKPTGGTLTGEGFKIAATSFASLQAHSDRGGYDVTKFYDAATDDTFEAYPGRSSLSDGAQLVEAISFNAVYAYATSGSGTDVARLHGSNKDDSFYGDAVAGSLWGNTFFYRAKSFEEVYAYAPEGGNDTAELHGTLAGASLTGSGGNETTLPYAEWKSTGGGFSYSVESFEQVNVHAVANSVAQLSDSSGNDEFVANMRTSYAMLSGEGFSFQLMSFQIVSVEAENGGNDLAKLYDSAGDDTLTCTPTEVKLADPLNSSYYAYNFDRVQVFSGSTAADHDVAELYDSYEAVQGGQSVDCDVVFYGTPIESGMYAYASPGNYDAFYNRVKFFEEVKVYATEGGNDVASLYDSALDDLLEAEDDWAKLTNLDAEGLARHLCQVSGFSHVTAVGDQGGTNQRRIVAPLAFVLDYEGTWQDI